MLLRHVLPRKRAAAGTPGALQVLSVEQLYGPGGRGDVQTSVHLQLLL